MNIKKIPPQVLPFMEIIPGILQGYLNRQSNAYYGMFGGGFSQGLKALTANKIYAMPFLVLKEESFNQIQIYVSVGSAGNARLGIYADNGNLVPGALVLDGGEIDTTTSGTKSVTINQLLSPGLYWMVLLCAATPTVSTNAYPINLLGLGSTSISGSGNQNGYVSDQVYGALPATHPTAALGGDYPLIVMRKA